MTTIRTAVDTAIILGSANYGSPLTITATGTIATASSGGTNVSFLASSAQPSLLPDFSAAGAAGWSYAASLEPAAYQAGSFDEHQLLAIGHAWVHAA